MKFCVDARYIKRLHGSTEAGGRVKNFIAFGSKKVSAFSGFHASV